jgi:hypothetical protein
MKLKSDNAVRYHFRRSGLTAICMVSNPDIYRVFADTSLSFNYPENLHHLTPFTVSLLRMVARLHSLADNFFRFMPFKCPTLCSAFGFPVFTIKFFAFRPTDFVSFIFKYNPNTAINHELMQLIYF